MTIADITLAIFGLCNTFRVLAYVPQIVKAATDKDGAKAISLATWALFLASHLSAAAYAFINASDWTLAGVFLGNAVGAAAILITAAVKRWQYKTRDGSQTGQQRDPARSPPSQGILKISHGAGVASVPPAPAKTAVLDEGRHRKR